MSHFIFTEEDHEVHESLTVAHLHVEVIFQFFLGQSYHVLPLYFVFVESLFIAFESHGLQKVNNFLNGPLLDVFDDEL